MAWKGIFSLLLFYVFCVCDEKPPLPSVLRVKTEQEREVTRLQDELKRAADRERQLRKQLVDINDQLTCLLLEKEMKDRDSKISVPIITHFLFACIIIRQPDSIEIALSFLSFFVSNTLFSAVAQRTPIKSIREVRS